MDLLLANHSSYPRVGESRNQQRLRHARAALERGELDRQEFERIEGSIVDEIIHEQEEAGLDLVTDGQVSWSDPVSHLLAPLAGVRTSGLLRFLDTNFYFRQPVIEARLRRRSAILAAEYRRARLAARLPVKAVLTGPYTLAHLSVLATTAYRNAAELAADLSIFLGEEIRDLVGAGVTLIQIDEPLILSRPGDIRLLREVLEPLHEAAGGAARLAVATYFGNGEPLYAQLNSLPGEVVALDLSESPDLVRAIADTGAGKVLALGIVDGRSTRMEDPDDAARRVERLLHRYVHGEAILQPSCGLEHLPRTHAAQKLALLSAIRDRLSGRPA